MGEKLLIIEETKEEKNFHLKKQQIIKKLIKFKTINTEYFKFFIYDNKKFNHNIKIIISKKNVRLAVKRNLCKRLIKETIRLNSNLLKNKNITVVAKKKPSITIQKNMLWKSIRKFLAQYIK